ALMRLVEIKSLIEILELNLKKKEILKLLKKDLRAFSFVRIFELKPVVEFLSDYLGGEKSAVELMQKDLRAFSMAQVFTLKKGIELYEINHGKEKTVAKIQESLRHFPLTRSFED
ncbi:MAG: hypothetical protein OXN83_02025, partial [Oligoflexia bacterium]|nr:hypothetical protein [Oligoflexia bacterium]